MYFTDTLYYLVKKQKRTQFLEIVDRVTKGTNKCRILVGLDMIWSSLRYGAMFTEYEDLSFYKRTNRNRNTFITTFYNFRLYDEINPREYRKLFHNKIEFLNNFKSLIRREWINLDVCSTSELTTFINRNKKLVLKYSNGDSGKEVELFDASECSASELMEYARSKRYNLAEACLSNHREIAKFNSSSLNTIRIVTVRKIDNTYFLFAGLRVGSKGSFLDNISQGGSVARIDLSTGKLNSQFYKKINAYHRSEESFNNEQEFDFTIPFWNEVKYMAKQASDIVPQMGIVAWDICVTEDGPEIIEGNESFGSVIMQVFSKDNEDGLKPKLLEILKGNGNV